MILEKLEDSLEILGFKGFELKTLCNSANMMIHVKPYDLVARLSRETSNITLDRMNNEISVSMHLIEKNVKVVSPSQSVNPGPYKCNKLNYSLWHYYEETEGKLTAVEACDLLDDLLEGLSTYNQALTVFGVWSRLDAHVKNLSNNKRQDVIDLLSDYKISHDMMISYPLEKLKPSHGDAHIRNLVHTSIGWLWTDFEDVSLMPIHWDKASLIANSFLFKGFDSKLVQEMINHRVKKEDLKEFLHILKARNLFSIIVNMDNALNGLGDLDFAELQLEKYKEGMVELDNYMKEIDNAGHD